MDTFNAPSVAIDGNIIRKIREEKRLTQLYVSKVVGVTTDTVSRWENNRYPTIMRDNALKLAEALEVDLDAILKQDHVPEVSDCDVLSPEVKKNNWIYYLLLVVLVVIVLLFLFLQSNSPPAPVLQAKRILPAFAAPGSRILVQMELSSEVPLKGMILKETFPQGWRLLESEPVISHLDAATGVARWIFRKPPLKMRVFYILGVPDTLYPDSEMAITGELIANPDGQRSVAIVKSSGTMQVKPVHWADKNGDYIIDDLEILEVSDLTEEAKTLHLNWDLLDEIWEAGSYQWEEGKKQFVPVAMTSN